MYQISIDLIRSITRQQVNLTKKPEHVDRSDFLKLNETSQGNLLKNKAVNQQTLQGS